jgi:hypothetical protein
MVSHSQESVVPSATFHTNTVTSSFSLVKRDPMGSFHRVSMKHVHCYLSEFESRFNARKASDLFSATLAAITKTETMPYAALKARE